MYYLCIVQSHIQITWCNFTPGNSRGCSGNQHKKFRVKMNTRTKKRLSNINNKNQVARNNSLWVLISITDSVFLYDFLSTVLNLRSWIWIVDLNLALELAKRIWFLFYAINLILHAKFFVSCFILINFIHSTETKKNVCETQCKAWLACAVLFFFLTRIRIIIVYALNGCLSYVHNGKPTSFSLNAMHKWHHAR